MLAVKYNRKRVKKSILSFFLILLVTILTIFTSKVFFTSNNEAETIIQQYIEYLNSKKWDEYVELFNYDNEGKEDLLSFLKDSKNVSVK